MRKIKELEEKFDKFERINEEVLDKLHDKVSQLEDIVKFLIKYDKNDIIIGTESIPYDTYYSAKYFHNGELEYHIYDNLLTRNYQFVKIVKNDKDTAIIEFTYCLIPNIHKFFKLDKETGNIIDVTDLMPAKELIENAGETLTNAINGLADIFEKELNKDKSVKNKPTKKTKKENK